MFFVSLVMKTMCFLNGKQNIVYCLYFNSNTLSMSSVPCNKHSYREKYKRRGIKITFQTFSKKHTCIMCWRLFCRNLWCKRKVSPSCARECVSSDCMTLEMLSHMIASDIWTCIHLKTKQKINIRGKEISYGVFQWCYIFFCCSSGVSQKVDGIKRWC